ncbi:MAG: hypothetical protein HY815_13605 [Candidatus Riflebacteria bacterium]|nr:hypothetical protein [Candidatus Riflebacteria bacterium]
MYRRFPLWYRQTAEAAAGSFERVLVNIGFFNLSWQVQTFAAVGILLVVLGLTLGPVGVIVVRLVANRERPSARDLLLIGLCVAAGVFFLAIAFAHPVVFYGVILAVLMLRVHTILATFGLFDTWWDFRRKCEKVVEAHPGPLI